MSKVTGALRGGVVKLLVAVSPRGVARSACVSTIIPIAISLIAPNVYATTPVGATTGAFAVSPSGAATYTIPIVVPPGTHGMQPNLSLVYNSQAGNGLVGLGWAIGGLSIIQHCGATLALDGFKGGINYDANDRFCLDGERLIPDSTLGANVYRTQHESWQKIVAYGGTATDPGYFTVTSKDGTVRYYGATSDSRIEAQGQTVAKLWALNQIQDISGNYLTITYQEDNAHGDFRPATVAYTGNASAGLAPYNTVYFDYAARPDVVPMYEGGSLVSTTQRLTGIRTYAGSTLVRQYNLGYDNNGSVGQSRLTSLQECGTDGVCLPATTFGWRNGGLSYTNTTWTGQPISDSGMFFVDLNGDGKVDAVTVSKSGQHYVSLSTGSGYLNQTWSGCGIYDLGAYFADLNGDGMTDYITIGSNGTACVNLSTGTGYLPNQTWYVQSLSGATLYSGGFHFGDLNGDGRADLVVLAALPGYNPYFYISYSVGNGFAGDGWLPSTYSWFNGPYYGDVNGDGRDDFLFYGLGSVSGGLCSGCYKISLSTAASRVNQSWTGWAKDYGYSGSQVVDLNGDGKADFITSDGAGNHYVSLSTGAGFAAQQWSAWADSTSGMKFADLNGDGKMDYVTVASNGAVYASLSTGAGYINQQWAGQPLSDSGVFFVDLNGDGLADYVTVSKSGTHYITLSNGPFPDLLISITNGLGAVTAVTYKPLTDSTVYTKDNDAVYPYQDVQNATCVVSRFQQSNGFGGNNTTQYAYGGLKKHLTADTSLGFRWIQVTDPTGLVTITYYNQTYDGTEGTVSYSQTYSGTVQVKATTNAWNGVALGQGRTWAKLSSVSEMVKELDNSFVTYFTTSYAYDSYGNPISITVNSWDMSRGIIDNTKTTVNTYNPPDTANWVLGQLTQAQVTASAPGQTARTRTSSFTYDSLGRLSSETIEPNSTTLWLTSVYGYDTFSNRVKKTVSGSDIPTRDEYALTFDARGQFVTNNKNALNQSVLYNSYDSRNGAVTSRTDPNGLTTAWQYNDGFARLTQETHPDQTYTTYTYSGCDATCPALAKTMTQIFTPGSGTTYVYHDLLGRAVRTQTQGFDGAWVYKDTAYGTHGIFSVTQPYYSGGPLYYTMYDYDSLGRVKTVFQTNVGASTIAYSGLTTTVTNLLGQQKITVKNSQGWVVSVTDAAGTADAAAVQYAYDSFGNLLTVTDANNNVVSMQYDIRGRKTSMSDPDMGNWSYVVDALGELTSQKDAKGQTISMIYDSLGRMTTRTTPEGTSTLTYDTAPYGKGKLAQVSNSSATESYGYDSYGRLNSTNTSIGGVNYLTSLSYDAYSQISFITYPGGYTLQRVYDGYGVLTQILDSAGKMLWQINPNGVDAHGRITSETYGNGVVAQRDYDPAAGYLQDIRTGLNGAASVQNLAYQFDALGNLLSRTDYNQTGLAESFLYDNLNRLKQVSGPSPKTYQYDVLGDLTYKSDVGQYTYPTNGVQPHAVSTIGTAPINYDANGNMVWGNGRYITYTSFNKPKTIATANTTTTLTYDANFNRLIKASGTTTTTYIGKLYEQIVNGSGTTGRYYIYAGTAVVGIRTLNPDGSSSVRYVHADHLGSVDTLTDDSGNIVGRYSYDAHGLPRNPDGTDATGTAPVPVRGFTGQEHDRNGAQLINLNAREYDPYLGRFLTPDTIVPGSLDSQSFNRYSYTSNNPLSYTDPAGHSRFSKWLHRVEKKYGQDIRGVVAVVAAVYGGPLIAGTFGDAFVSAGITSSAVADGVVGGAIAGRVIGGDTRGAEYGAIGGGIIGGFADYGALGQATGSGINGYLQTGNSEGFLRGFASGAVPQDLGFTNAYQTEPYANIGIGIARDAARGYIVGGPGGIVPGIEYGQFDNAVGHLVGFTTSGFSAPKFDQGAFIYEGSFWNERGAITFGNVISGREGLSSNTAYLAAYTHERDHIFNPVEQGLGALYIPTHALDLTVGYAGMAMGHGYDWFFMEEHVQNCPYSKLLTGGTCQ